MPEEVECKNCGGIATLSSEYGALKTYLCGVCNNQTEIIVHYLEEPIQLEAKSYKAVVSSCSHGEAKKAAIKIRRIFSDYSNFYEGDLQSQLSAGLLVLELGIYSDREVALLAPQAEAMNLNLQFILLPPTTLD